MLYSHAMKTLLKKITPFLILFFIASISSAQDNNADLNAYKPNAESVSANEKGVEIINKDPKLAEQFFQKALSLDNKNISALLNYATLKISQKKGNEIINILETYSKTYPKIADIHYLLGDIYFADKQIDKALESYKKVLILNSNAKGLFVKLGNIYFLKKNLSNANFMYEQAYKEDPKNTSVLNNYANVLLANHDVNKAITIIKESLALKETPEGYYTLATAYEIKKDIPQALENYKKAKELKGTQADLEEKINTLSNSIESF